MTDSDGTFSCIAELKAVCSALLRAPDNLDSAEEKAMEARGKLSSARWRWGRSAFYGGTSLCTPCTLEQWVTLPISAA